MTPMRGEALGSYLAQMPANLVSKVEVVPNPSAKNDPEGLAGIINIVLKQNTDLGTSGGYTLGVLVQTNFGGLLTVAGVPLWKQLGMNPFAPPPAPPNAGSIMIVIATDAPLSDRNLERLAKRALVGLSRTGTNPVRCWK